MLDQSRSTHRRRAVPAAEDAALKATLLEKVRLFPRWGYRKMTHVLKNEGWQVNHKRVHRLWTELGLHANRMIRRDPVPGDAANACHVRRAERRNHVWTVDFVFNATSDGQPLKWLTIHDEYTRECISIHVARRIDHHGVMDVLLDVMMQRGKPALLRTDNGGEFVAGALRKNLASMNSDILFIEPGAPWQNGYAESFHAQFRREVLDCEVFETLLDAQRAAREYKQVFNNVKPHGKSDDNGSSEHDGDGNRHSFADGDGDAAADHAGGGHSRAYTHGCACGHERRRAHRDGRRLRRGGVGGRRLHVDCRRSECGRQRDADAGRGLERDAAADGHAVRAVIGVGG